MLGKINILRNQKNEILGPPFQSINQSTGAYYISVSRPKTLSPSFPLRNMFILPYFVQHVNVSVISNGDGLGEIWDKDKRLAFRSTTCSEWKVTDGLLSNARQEDVLSSHLPLPKYTTSRDFLFPPILQKLNKWQAMMGSRCM